MTTQNRNDKLVDFAKSRGVRRYKSRKKSLIRRLASVIAGFLYGITIEPIVYFFAGVEVVRR